MEIIQSEYPDSSLYFKLLHHKYGKQKNYPYFLEDVQKSLEFTMAYQKPHFFLVKKEAQILGHCALLLNSGLPSGEAFFGFFDVSDEKDVGKKLWESLCTLAIRKGITIIKGPVNATAWHQYRAIKETDQSEFFKTELFSNSSYYDFFTSLSPSKEILYHSGYREKFEAIINITKPAYQQAVKNGFSIEETETVTAADLHSVLQLSSIVFKENWGYTELSSESFRSIYSLKKLENHLNKIYFLKKGKEIIGYLSSLIEDNTTLILKTIAILPSFQSLGLGNALVYRAHKDAMSKGYKKIIYALIREDNNIKRFPKDDAIIFRRYAVFEFML